MPDWLNPRRLVVGAALVLLFALALAFLGPSGRFWGGSDEQTQSALRQLRSNDARREAAQFSLPEPAGPVSTGIEPNREKTAARVERRKLSRRRRALSAQRRREKAAARSQASTALTGAIARRQLEPDVEIEPEEEPRLAPIVRFGGGPRPEPLQVPEEDALEIMVAMRRLRDSGALRKLTPEELTRVTELMPDSRGVQDADRILRERLGIGVDEFLAQHLAYSKDEGAVEQQ